MPNFLLVSIGISCLVVLSHSVPLDADARIVNGMNTNTSVYPFIASFRATYYGYYLHRFCGATLIGINPPIIMTAAHCVDGISQAENGSMYAESGGYTYPATVYLDIGRTKAAEPMPNTPYQTLNLTDLDAQLFIHPQWDPDHILWADIAILIFRNQTLRNDTKYANIPDQYDDDEECCTQNEDVFAIGWGANGTNSSTNPKKLQKTTLQFLEYQVCQTRLVQEYGFEQDTIDEFVRIICVGGNNTDICYGDSGGPLVRYDDDDDVEVIGVASFVLDGCNTNGKMPRIIPSGYTGVGYYRNWIDKMINLIVYGITAQPSVQPTYMPTSEPTQTDGCSSVYNNYFHVFCSMIIIYSLCFS